MIKVSYAFVVAVMAVSPSFAEAWAGHGLRLERRATIKAVSVLNRAQLASNKGTGKSLLQCDRLAYAAKNALTDCGAKSGRDSSGPVINSSTRQTIVIAQEARRPNSSSAVDPIPSRATDSTALREKTVTATSWFDGLGDAPNCAAQHPNLLTAYIARPPWKVAGVDYCVGYADNQSLRDPSVQTNLPDGATYRPGPPKNVTITGENVTINGFDFSLHGGIQLLIDGARGITTVTNNKFGYAAALTAGEIQLARGGGTLNFSNNVVDGGGAAGGQGIALIYNNSGAAKVIFQYNWIKNLPSIVYANAAGGASVTYKYNMIENVAAYPGEHLNILEWSGIDATNSVDASFNTVLQYISGSPGGEIFQLYNNGDNAGAYRGDILSSADIGNNTIVAPLSNPNARTRENHMVIGPGAVLYVPSAPLRYYQNYTGQCNGCTAKSCVTALSLPGTYVSARQNTEIIDGTCQIRGSNYSISYLIHGSNDSFYITKMMPGPSWVHDNYVDSSGALKGGQSCVRSAQSMFYPGTFGTGHGPLGTVAWTAPSGNIDMNTGASGCRHYPFLLERDLAPTSHDNTPAFIARAA